MRSFRTMGAHDGAHPARLTDWDTVRIFLQVARIGSFRAAASELCVSANFLKKRISQLETASQTQDALAVGIETRLFDMAVQQQHAFAAALVGIGLHPRAQFAKRSAVNGFVQFGQLAREHGDAQRAALRLHIRQRFPQAVRRFARRAAFPIGPAG